jgi:hypothetical protein
MSSRVRVISAVSFIFIVAIARPAAAQWYSAAYLGANHTPPSDVAVAVPALNLSLTYQDVQFEAKPFKSPQYYGGRLGRLIGAKRRIGIEIEFIHLKVIGQTSQVYPVTGNFGSITGVTTQSPMSAVVEQYQMTHGLNFILGNVMGRLPLGAENGPLTLIVRGGAGPTFPHAESRVAGESVNQYEWAGLGVHAAAGLNIRIAGPVSALAEYKITFARPEITVGTGGTGRMTATTHQFAFGLTFGLAAKK